MGQVLAELGNLGIIPVAVVSHAEDAPRLAEALSQAGLPCVEITFRTSAAEEAIRQTTHLFPQMLVGAGTILSPNQARKAVAAGARFVVSPGFDSKVVSWCLNRGIPITPGVATATEISMALDKGLKVVKFFPAEELGGVRMLRALGAAYATVRFIPTGGISPDNLASYLRLPMVHACGGSWLAKNDLIQDGKFAEITRLAKEALNIVQQVREGSNLR
jgi:2-dehydro-3-deoxyphosphogluconate aldolase/(4S)-4-hydroxy-2-oxoglutarate aldolase